MSGGLLTSCGGGLVVMSEGTPLSLQCAGVLLSSCGGGSSLAVVWGLFLAAVRWWATL